jgi:hypothetical protein
MAGRTVDVVLLSDPDLPAELADRLVLDLPDLLAEQVSPDVTWRVDEVMNPLAGDEQVDVTHMVEVVGSRMPELGWDFGIFLTDLPRRAGRHPVVAELSTSDRIALVSLPALGTLRLYPRVREAVVALIAHLFADHPASTGKPPAARLGRARPLSRDEDDLPAGTLFVVPGARGNLRLLAGMVRANRPWRLFRGLSKALAGVFAVAAFALTSSDVWRLAPPLGPERQTILTLAAIAALVTWLVVDHELWERPEGRRARDRAVLYNAATVVTLTLGVLVLYAVLIAVLIPVVALLLDGGVLQTVMGRYPTWTDYADIVWFTASASMVGGALGAGLEDDSVVRLATYGERQRQRQRQANGGSDDRSDQAEQVG